MLHCPDAASQAPAEKLCWHNKKARKDSRTKWHEATLSDSWLAISEGILWGDGWPSLRDDLDERYTASLSAGPPE